MDNNIPVFFVHSGNNDYLKYTIKQAESTNNSVILLGDDSNVLRAMKWVHMDDYITDKFIDFTNKYVHMAFNPYLFELNCFRRYFVTYEYSLRNKIDRFMMLDSDLLAYGNYSEIDFGNCIAGFSIPKDQDLYSWTASPHCSYWTLEGMKEFLDFLIYEYTIGIHELEEKWKYHQENQIIGGICDMTLLYLWANKIGKNKIFNTTIIRNNTVFDHFLSVSEGYEKGTFPLRKFCNIKKIKFEDGKAYFKNRENKWIRTYSIHAQGKSKIYIKTLYQQKNNIWSYRWDKISNYATRIKLKLEKIVK